MLEECRFFYEKLYATGPEVDQEDFLADVNVNMLTDVQCLETEAPFTLEEFLQSLNLMNGSTSPGPDGYTVPFYKAFWDQLGTLVFNAATECYNRSTVPREVLESITILIPKKNENIATAEAFRPISLLNVLFKIIAKTLARRVANITNFIIKDDQTAFILTHALLGLWIFPPPAGGRVFEHPPPPRLSRLLRIVEQNGKQRSKAREKSFRNHFGHFLAQVKIEVTRGQNSKIFQNGFYDKIFNFKGRATILIPSCLSRQGASDHV